jgi:hypothetical protein
LYLLAYIDAVLNFFNIPWNFSTVLKVE